jgi:hypothetical protein
MYIYVYIDIYIDIYIEIYIYIYISVLFFQVGPLLCEVPWEWN